MKFQVNKDVLSDAVSFAVRILPAKNTLQILSGVLIEADANALLFTVYDFEVSAQAEVVAKVEESGRVLVSARLLSEIISNLPNAPVEISTDGNKLAISCGKSNFKLPTMDASQYPAPPEHPAVTGTIAGEVFSEAVSQVAIAASREDVTPMLTGVMLEGNKDKLTLIATDRFRVAMADVAWKGSASEVCGLVPAKILLEVSKTFANQPEVSISLSGSEDRPLVAFKANNRSVTTQLVKGTFPPVKTLFPTDVPDYAVVTKQDLIESTRRVSKVLERDSALRYTFTSDKVTLDATGNETGEGSDYVEIELTGKDIVVSLKPQFLVDGLSGIHSEFAKISFTNNENPHKPGPVLITSHGAKDSSDNFRYLLQPNLLR